MDNTELHYLTFDPDAIYVEMQTAYMEAGGSVLYPGDEKEMLLRAVQSVIIQAFAGVDNALRMQTLRYAVGEYLDVIGENRNCPRIEAVNATARVQIVTNTVQASETLPAGTPLTADGEQYWQLSEDVSLSGAAQTLQADIVCAKAGSAGNALTAGTQMYLSTASAAINSITVITAASGGTDTEDDDTYRERIREHGLASVTTGPAQQYESVTKAVSSAIVDAKALNAGAGNVNVWLLFADGTTEAVKGAIISEVESALNADDTRPLTDHVSVDEAEDVAYTLNVGYTLGSGVTLASLTAAVSEYQSWQDRKIGQPFNPDRLMALLYQAGAMRVTWLTGSEIAGGGVAYTEIGASQRLVGTITLVAI